MTIKPIKTHEDYEAALSEVERLLEHAESEEDHDTLDVLATLIEAYEAKQFPIAPPDPIAAIEYEMEKRGLGRKDIEPHIGHSGRVSEILNRQRPLTVNMIRNLHKAYGIPADILMAEYPTARKMEREDIPYSLDRFGNMKELHTPKSGAAGTPAAKVIKEIARGAKAKPRKQRINMP